MNTSQTALDFPGDELARTSALVTFGQEEDCGPRTYGNSLKFEYNFEKCAWGGTRGTRVMSKGAEARNLNSDKALLVVWRFVGDHPGRHGPSPARGAASARRRRAVSR
eukprot:1275742-Rhodomonas_salina.2